MLHYTARRNGDTAKNNWRVLPPPGGQSGLRARVLRQADGAMQTLPWEMHGWHCGGAGK
ncbi:MAG: hypothetical protein V8S57_08115 [Oscillospiraceae bacterium]